MTPYLKYIQSYFNSNWKCVDLTSVSEAARNEPLPEPELVEREYGCDAVDDGSKDTVPADLTKGSHSTIQVRAFFDEKYRS